jgi:hypothetical protein
MSNFTFEFGPKLFVFVYSGAKLVHFKEIGFAICNTNITKCNRLKN